MALPKVSFGKFGTLKRGSSGGKLTSAKLKEAVDEKTTDPKHLHPGPKTLEVKLAKKSTTPATVTVSSPGLVAPVVVTIPAGETTALVTVDIVDVAGAYELSLTNPSGCVAATKNLKIKVPCVVAFDAAPFEGGIANLRPGQTVDIRVQFTAKPSVDATVAISCPGFAKPKDSIKIPAGATSPVKHSVTLETKFGEYTATLGKTTECVLRDKGEKKEKALGWSVEETFKLASKIYFGPTPIAPGQGDPVVVEPGANVTLNVRMAGTCATDAEYKLTGTGLTGIKPKYKPPSPTAAAWTLDFVAETAPGKYEIELEAIKGVEAKGKVKFEVPLYVALPVGGAWEVEPAPGAKGKIKVELSAAAQKDTKITLTSKGFSPKAQKFVIPAGQTVLECDVDPGTKFGGFAVELTASEPAVVRPERSQATFRLVDDKDSPEIGFPKKEPVVGKLKKKYECGEIVPFRVAFSRDTLPGGATFELTSGAFAQAFTKTVMPGDVDEPVQCDVQIDDRLFDDGSTVDKKVKILLVGTTDCTVGDLDSLELTVAPPIGVEFAEAPFKPQPNAGYHRGETIKVRVSFTRTLMFSPRW